MEQRIDASLFSSLFLKSIETLKQKQKTTLPVSNYHQVLLSFLLAGDQLPLGRSVRHSGIVGRGGETAASVRERTELGTRPKWMSPSPELSLTEQLGRRGKESDLNPIFSTKA